MKKLIVILTMLLASTGVWAQWHYPVRGYYARPRVSIGIGIGAFAPWYPAFGYFPGYIPLYAYPPAYGYGYGYHSYRSSKLDMEIRDIEHDYNQRIYEAKHDKTMKRKERKKKVHELEYERDKAIIQAKKDYYNSPPPRRHHFSSDDTDNN